MTELPRRKQNRLRNYNYSQSGAYFITICVKDRHHMLGEITIGDAPLNIPNCLLSDYGEFVDAQIQKISTIYPHVSVENYVVMPNHIHMLLILKNRTLALKSGTHRGASPTKACISQIVRTLKSITTKQFGFAMWQRSYHDHIVRDEAEYLKIWQYISDNPAKWHNDCYNDTRETIHFP